MDKFVLLLIIALLVYLFTDMRYAFLIVVIGFFITSIKKTGGSLWNSKATVFVIGELNDQTVKKRIKELSINKELDITNRHDIYHDIFYINFKSACDEILTKEERLRVQFTINKLKIFKNMYHTYIKPGGQIIIDNVCNDSKIINTIKAIYPNSQEKISNGVLAFIV